MKHQDILNKEKVICYQLELGKSLATGAFSQNVSN